MCKGFFSKVKSLFKKNDSSLLDIDVNVSTETKKIKKSKKLKDSNDYSVDNSTNINGIQDNSTHKNIYVNQSSNSDLIISARWKYLIPHKMDTVSNGYDKMIGLVPVDKNIVYPSLYIDFDNTNNEKNAIYVLVNKNPNVRNLQLKQFVAKSDTCNFTINESKDIFGLLDKDRSFAILYGDLRIGNGTLTLEFAFEVEKKHYIQTFKFVTRKSSEEFVLQHYNDPQQDNECFVF